MRTAIIILTFLSFILAGCKETIIQEQIPKEFTNDLLHADLLGKVTQKNSRAIVIVSQLTPIDSVEINPGDGSFAFRDLRAGNYDVTIRAEDYRIYQRLNLMLEGGTVNYLGEVNLSTVPDLVESFYPENNGEIVYDWRYGRITVSILFTHPMDRESVEKAFTIEPEAEGVFYWGNYTTEPREALFANKDGYVTNATITTFSKVSALTYSLARKDSYPDTTYTITLNTTAKDTSGNYLRFPLKFKFKTVQSYQSQNGIQTDPVHGDIDVSPINYNGITITFPRRMNKQSVESNIEVTPAMSTVYLWPDENILRIYTGGPFLSDTTIKVRINKTAKDKDGVLMGYDFEFSFRTAALNIINSSPSNGQLFVTPTEPISIYFNNYVTLSSAQSAFSISPSAAGTIGYGGYYPYEQKNQIVFTPSSALKPNTKYTITISSSVNDMFGKPMKSSYSFSFVTRPN